MTIFVATHIIVICHCLKRIAKFPLDSADETFSFPEIPPLELNLSPRYVSAIRGRVNESQSVKAARVV